MWGVEVQLYSFLTPALDEDGSPTPRPGRFTPGNDWASIVQEAAWAPRLVRTDVREYLFSPPGYEPRTLDLVASSSPGAFYLYSCESF
jgi:hypothetical protein